jgi:hypothetical protein
VPVEEREHVVPEATPGRGVELVTLKDAKAAGIRVKLVKGYSGVTDTITSLSIVAPYKAGRGFIKLV